MPKKYFAYVMTNRRRGVLYVGSTGDLLNRVSAHKQKLALGFTSTYGTSVLVHVEEYPSMMEARAREHSLKRWRRQWKFELVEKLNPEWRDLSSELQL
jgi:putative endonuclease